MKTSYVCQNQTIFIAFCAKFLIYAAAKNNAIDLHFVVVDSFINKQKICGSVWCSFRDRNEIIFGGYSCFSIIKIQNWNFSKLRFGSEKFDR